MTHVVVCGECSYGNYRGGDPRRFRPDPGASSRADRARWRADCARWDVGDTMPIQVPCGTGVSWAARYGYGTTLCAQHAGRK